MARDSFQQTQIPSGVADIPYPDYRTLAQSVFKHAASYFMGTVTGAGGVGDILEEVPFEPAIVIAINPAGANPAFHISTFGDTADHITMILGVLLNSTPPVLSGSDNDWDVSIPVGMAPNAEVLTVICIGFAQVGGSE